MPNNIVFNPVASQLATQIYGAQGANVLPIAVDTHGYLIITGTVTANESPSFTSITATITTLGPTATAALSEDVSQYRTVSFYVNNTSATFPFTAILQDAPVNSETYFVDDKTAVTVDAGTSVILTPYYLLHYTRVLLTGDGTDSASAVIYYNAQT